MAVWDPRSVLGGLDDLTVKEVRFLLWKGHCSVHQRFRPEHIQAFRDSHPGGTVIVHPECSHEVVARADEVGSTDYIIAAVNRAPVGSVIAVATEIHLVQRLAAEHPDRSIVSLDPLICPCSTMFRIDAAHLCWVLEELVAGRVVNQIRVDDDVAEWAKVALQRMLDIT
jgi:quinolinate synthase